MQLLTSQGQTYAQLGQKAQVITYFKHNSTTDLHSEYKKNRI